MVIEPSGDSWDNRSLSSLPRLLSEQARESVMAACSTGDLCDASTWMPFASGGAVCTVTADGGALRIDFDFRGEKGFVGIRRPFDCRLPDPFGVTFSIRGQGPPNALEFKLADVSNENAWRWRDDAFHVAPERKLITLRESQIDFAWGPAGAGRLHRLGAVELVVAAGPGGAGTLWIEDLRLVDRSSRSKPLVSASSHASGSGPLNVLSKASTTAWKPATGDQKPWLQFDFHEPREYGGLIVDWGSRPAVRQFDVLVSETGKNWKTAYRSTRSAGARSFVPIAGGESRYLRLAFRGPAEVRHVELQAFDFAKSRDDLFAAIAKRTTKGAFPRYLLGEQSYWTCAGVPAGETCALINEEGLIEPDRGTFSIEPFLILDDKVVTWADVRRSVRLEAAGVPIPTVLWKGTGFTLETTAFAIGEGKEATLLIRYRVRNNSRKPKRGKLFAAIRPHQVSPPWQRWREIGGISEVREIAWQQGAAWVNRSKAIVPLVKPSTFGAITFDEGLLIEWLAAGKLPRQDTIKDDHALASAAMGFNLSLRPGATRDLYLAVPFGFSSGIRATTIKHAGEINGAAAFEEAVQKMSAAVDGVTFNVPAGVATNAADTYRTAAGQILINRDGPALQPGPRRYTRSWIRDGAIMGAALARAGDASVLTDFIRWYSPYQRDDGFVPCCVDRSGPDWLVEHDSHGQLIYAVMEAFRFARDKTLLQELWPAIRRAALFIEKLCESSTDGNKRQQGVTRGLLPISASHEGYLAQPVHSYWDDFWGVRGLIDAAAAAAELGRRDDAQRFLLSAETLRAATSESIRRVIDAKQLTYVPGSVEWADFDPTATANALAIFPDTAGLPEEQLRLMFEQFVSDSRKRRRGEAPWKNYSAYEIRIVGALVRLGWRKEAQEYLEFYLSDRRPKAWNQWPEITWRNPRSPGHLGDIPHTWIGAEFMHVFSSLLAYERETDQSLVLAAGIPANWISRRPLSVEGLPTWYGRLNLSLRRLPDERLEIAVGGKLRVPPGGIVLRPPGPGPIRSAELDNGERLTSTSESVRLGKAPVVVRLSFEHTEAGN
jgi:hypothetical protein